MNTSLLPELNRLLSILVKETQLPLLDRWFAQKNAGKGAQGELWEALRLCVLLAESYVRSLEPRHRKGSLPLSWNQIRPTLAAGLGAWASFALESAQAGPDPDPCRWGIPAWLVQQWTRRRELSNWSPAKALEFLRAQVKPAALHLRFAAGKPGEAAREAWLAANGTLTEVLEGVWVATGKTSVFQTEAWKTGAVEIQDAASFEAARLAGARPGQMVWDVCAGRGGKTTALAAEMRGKGALWATDVADFKLVDLRRRVARSGWQNVRVQPWDGKKIPPFTLEVEKHGGFDRILVDAPCSASGTWRRDPDARFRIDPASLRQLEKQQDELLVLVWSQLKVGGHLTYVTCSWLPSENEDRVVQFEKFAGTSASRHRQQLLGQPEFDANTMFVAQWEKLS